MSGLYFWHFWVFWRVLFSVAGSWVVKTQPHHLNSFSFGGLAECPDRALFGPIGAFRAKPPFAKPPFKSPRNENLQPWPR